MSSNTNADASTESQTPVRAFNGLEETVEILRQNLDDAVIVAHDGDFQSLHNATFRGQTFDLVETANEIYGALNRCVARQNNAHAPDEVIETINADTAVTIAVNTLKAESPEWFDKSHYGHGAGVNCTNKPFHADTVYANVATRLPEEFVPTTTKLVEVAALTLLTLASNLEKRSSPTRSKTRV